MSIDNELKTILDKIIEDLKQDQIPYLDDSGDLNPIPIAPRLLNKVDYWEGEKDDLYKALVDLTITFAGNAFSKMSGLEVPKTYEEVANFNKYWREHGTSCKVNRSTLRPIFMTLRDALSNK